MALTDEQIERYSRHIILKEVGAKGQKKLLNAKVLIIGAGGLGSIPFFIPMGNTEFLNLFHIFNSIRSCVQNYFFTPEIEIVKQLKNNEV